MKVEIEVTEAEIKDAIERKARIAIAEYSERTWLHDSYTRKLIQKHWEETVEKVIKEQCENSDAIKAMVIKKIEAKIQGQVTALMKVKK